MANTVERVIRIKIDAGQARPELKALADSIGGMNKSLKSAAGALDFFKVSFLGLSFGYVAREIFQMTDSMISLSAKVRVVSGSTEEANKTLEDLVSIANRTRSPLETIVQSYTRLASSTKEAGISGKSLQLITETLQNTFRLSGATAQEAAATAIQLAQGFASGQLRGQELRSVMEQNAELGRILSKSLGITRGEIYKLAEAGRLTAGTVFKALAASMVDVNKRAGEMKTTFAQTVDIALNRMKVALLELETRFDLSGKFATTVDVIMQKFTLTMAVAAGAITILAISKIPALISNLNNLAKAITLVKLAMDVAARNPLLIAVTAISAAVIFLNDDLGDLEGKVKSLGETFNRYQSKASKPFIKGVITLLEKAGKGSSDLAKTYRDSLKTSEEYEKSFLSLGEKQKEGVDTQKDYAKFLAEIDELQRRGNEHTRTRKELLAEINVGYSKGKITLSEYIKLFRAAPEENFFRAFKDGKKDLQEFNQAKRELEIVRLRESFDEGRISLEQFNKSLETSKVETLNEKLQFGKINLTEFNKELAKTIQTLDGGVAFRVGFENYLSGIGTVTDNMANAIAGTFTKLEDAIFDFTKTGKFNFQDFAQSVLDDINKVLIRAYIVGPIVQGLLGMFGASPAAGTGIAGGIGQPQPLPFADGGIVTGRTNFGFGGGRSGVMGEAGPEAILPLQKASDGSLGVSASVAPVHINIINNANADVSQTESTGPSGEKQIDIMIISKVKNAFANGVFDKTMQTAYGVNRKGS